MAYTKTPSRPAAEFGSIFGPLFRFVGQIRRRHQFNRMLDLDDRMLDDIGVTRFDVLEASRLPLARNAGLELRRMVDERSRLSRRRAIERRKSREVGPEAVVAMPRRTEQEQMLSKAA